MKRLLSLLFVLVALAATAAPSVSDEKDLAVLDDDERLIESAGLPCEGPGLLEFFRIRARTESEPGRIDDLMRRVSGPSLEDRVQAGADLIALGPLAIPGLRRVVNDLEVPEAREWARRCLSW